MRSRRLIVASVGLWLGAGCQSHPDLPVSFVSGLRVLGAQARPPQVDADGSTEIALLVVDTDARPIQATWNLCLRAPLAGQTVNPDCIDASEAPFLVPIDYGTSDGLSIVAHVPQVPREALGEPDATNGVYLPFVAQLTDGLDVVTAVYRLRLADGTPVNHNPTIASVDLLDPIGVATLLDPAVPLVVHGGDQLTLGTTYTADSVEAYTAADGSVATETVTTSWFCTAGELSVERTSPTQPHTVLRLNTRMPSPGQTIDLYAVARDGRGGSDYVHHQLVLE
jgi:hypothetical protein